MGGGGGRRGREQRMGDGGKLIGRERGVGGRGREGEKEGKEVGKGKEGKYETEGGVQVVFSLPSPTVMGSASSTYT